MKTKKVGFEIFKFLEKSGIDTSTEGTLTIKGAKKLSTGKRAITLDMTDEYISIWSAYQSNKIKKMEVNLFVLNRIDESLWVGGMIDRKHSIESKILSKKSVEYMCAINGMKSLIGDLFLMRPHDLRVLEVMDLIGSKSNKSSVQNYLKVLFKMIAND